MFAEQYTVRDIGFAMVAMPVIYMMSFSPGWRPIAVWMNASAPFQGEDVFLRGRKQSLVATSIERYTRTVETRLVVHSSAGEPLKRRDGDCVGLTPNVCCALALVNSTSGRGNVDGGGSGPEQCGGVSVGAKSQQLLESV